MDASGVANKTGNGSPDPSTASIPSGLAAPTGAPAPIIPATPRVPAIKPGMSNKQIAAAVAAGAPDPRRDPLTGRILPGFTLAPQGNKTNHPPNRNKELAALFTSGRLKKAIEIAFDAAKNGDTDLLKFLLERSLIKLTPEAAGVTIHNNPTASAQAGASAKVEQANDRLEELGDPKIRGAFCDLVDRIAEGRGVSGAARRDGN